jgi:hypothetical protein
MNNKQTQTEAKKSTKFEKYGYSFKANKSVEGIQMENNSNRFVVVFFFLAYFVYVFYIIVSLFISTLLNKTKQQKISTNAKQNKYKQTTNTNKHKHQHKAK